MQSAQNERNAKTKRTHTHEHTHTAGWLSTHCAAAAAHGSTESTLSAALDIQFQLWYVSTHTHTDRRTRMHLKRECERGAR